MPRILLDLPAQFCFSTTIPIRITDLNYGGHVGNDTILTIIHEARIQFLQHLGFTETNIGGKSLIMGDVGIVFKNEAFYGDLLQVSITVSDVQRVSFDIVYLIEKETAGKRICVAQAKTGMVCFDYQKRKVISIPDEVVTKFHSISSNSPLPE